MSQLLLRSPIMIVVIVLAIASLACSLTTPATDYLAATPPHPTTTQKPTLMATTTPTAGGWNDCVVTATALNIRACPGVNCAIVGWLLDGQTVNAAPAIDGWLTIKLTDSKTGYIAARYCDFKE